MGGLMPEGYVKGRPDSSWWMQQIHRGISYRKKCADEGSWDKWRKMYRGQWRGDILPANMFYTMLRTIVPRIYFRNPSVSIVSAKPGLENLALAKMLERIDNKMLLRMKTKGQLKRIVRNAVMFGSAFGKIGFGSQYAPPSLIGENTVGQDKKGNKLEYSDLLDNFMPWFMSTHPGQVIFPSKLDEFDNSPWVGHWVRRSAREVQDDPNLKNVSNIKGSFPTAGMQIPGQHNKMQYPVEMVDLIEIRDRRTGKVFVLAPFSSDRILLEEEDTMQQLGKLPILDLVFNEDDEFCWGVPDSRILEPYQLELNEVRTQNMKHRRAALVKLLAKKGAFDEGNLPKLNDEDVAAVIETNLDPNSSVEAFKIDIPTDALSYDRVVVDYIRESLGFSRNQMADFKQGSGDTTATEAQIVQMASEIRIDERRDATADLLVEMIEMLHPVMFEHWTEDQVVEVIGPGGVPLWVEVSGNMIKSGRYDLKVDPDSSVPETRVLREQKAIQMYGILKDNPLIDPVILTRFFLHELKGVAYDDMLKMPEVAGAMGATPQRPMQFGDLIKQIQGAAQAGVE